MHCIRDESTILESHKGLAYYDSCRDFFNSSASIFRSYTAEMFITVTFFFPSCVGLDPWADLLSCHWLALTPVVPHCFFLPLLRRWLASGWLSAPTDGTTTRGMGSGRSTTGRRSTTWRSTTSEGPSRSTHSPGMYPWYAMACQPSVQVVYYVFTALSFVCVCVCVFCSSRYQPGSPA